jgi:hypothetical protein
MNIVRHTQGSVYVETLIAVLVPITFFFSTWQQIDLFTAQLILKHAAVAAARAAIVVGPDDPRFYEDQAVNDLSKGGPRYRDVERAAALVLAAAPNLQTGLGVDIEGSTSGTSPITAKVTTDYACHGGWLNLVCGGGKYRRLSAQATLPYQGAKFKYVGK